MSPKRSPDTAALRPAGLRERKKEQTRTAIRQHALSLFRERGYAATTVGEVAEAAEVATSTVFRYFPTKEDLILSDEFDRRVIEAFRAQPSQLSPVQAMRQAVRSVYAELSPEDLQLGRERHALILAEPELRSAAINEAAQGGDMIARIVAERCNLDPEQFEVRNLAGAIVGITITAMYFASERPGVDYGDLIDQGLDHLDAGLPLSECIPR